MAWLITCGALNLGCWQGHPLVRPQGVLVWDTLVGPLGTTSRTGDDISQLCPHRQCFWRTAVWPGSHKGKGTSKFSLSCWLGWM